jgi:putative acyl-CoA dehydrogenase
VNSIWEGSGNVNCLDVLRTVEREPESLEAFHTELELARGANTHLDAALGELAAALADEADLEARARRLVERLALCLQASLLVRHAPPEVADAFCATRLGGDGGRAYGTLPRAVDTAAIVERHRPRLG